MALGTERTAQVLEREVRVDRVAAGEQIDRREAVLGPGVDREVGLGDDDHARDTVRRERVNHLVERGCPGEHDRGDQGRLDARGVIEELAIAPVVLAEQVPTQCLHPTYLQHKVRRT